MQEQDSVVTKDNKLVKLLISSELYRIFIIEFLATAFLMFMVTSVGTLPPFQDHPKQPNIYKLVYVAVIVYVIICFVGPFTGAHINPAITLGIQLQKKQKSNFIKTILAYWVAQFLGGLVGTLISRNIYGNGGAPFDTMPEVVDLGKYCIQELVGTFFFMFFILLVTNQQTTFVYDEAWVHLMIGIFYYFCLTIAHTFHYINPAVVTSLQFEGMISDGTSSAGLPAAFLLILVQFVGAVLASLVFKKVYLTLYIKWKSKLMDD